MANFLSKFFTANIPVDFEKLELKAQLSLENSVFDKNLFSLAIKHERSNLISSYLEKVLKINTQQLVILPEEIAVMEMYIHMYKILRFEDLYITYSFENLELSDTLISAFILMPLLQNAIINGYNSMEKYPIRVKLRQVGDILKYEVSNRVNHHILSQADNAIIYNYKARLSLLYPNNHELLISSNSNVFKATLTIFLNVTLLCKT